MAKTLSFLSKQVVNVFSLAVAKLMVSNYDLFENGSPILGPAVSSLSTIH